MTKKNKSEAALIKELEAARKAHANAVEAYRAAVGRRVEVNKEIEEASEVLESAIDQVAKVMEQIAPGMGCYPKPFYKLEDK